MDFGEFDDAPKIKKKTPMEEKNGIKKKREKEKKQTGL
jgi:hypothetical protein